MLTARPGLRGYSVKDLRACAEREVKMRRRVYARWVEKGKMTKEMAELEIDKMEAIGEVLEGLDESDRLI
jgi:hypothetical protein